MPGRFIDSPNLVGKLYEEVADYPYDKPIAQQDNKFVYKGRRKVLLVVDGIVADFYDWDIYGSQYRNVQKRAQVAWGIDWKIT